MTFSATVMEHVKPTGFRWDVGETAIVTFERIHGLNVTVHDLAGTLGPFLPPHRFHHCASVCVAVKAHRFESCVQFDIARVRSELANRPEGRFHVCHAGIVEWAIPVFDQDKMQWVLFAGPRLPGPDLVSAVVTQNQPWAKNVGAKGSIRPATVGEEEAQLIMEHLRQLSARLRLWVRDLNLNSSMTRTVPDGSAPGGMTAVGSMNLRRGAILRFIEEKFHEPVTLEMLAKRLSLSASRTSHVVRRHCQTNFRDLVIQKRLRVAMELLRQSNMSVLEVSLACGFDDVAHFHRLFRRRVGYSPGQYRISGQS